MWVEDLHPRDEYGRFRLVGMRGHFDKLAGGTQGQHYARTIGEWERNQGLQAMYVKLRDAGTLTATEDADWDRLVERAAELRDKLPKAYFLGMRPHSDGTWRYPERNRPQGMPRHMAFDERGRQLPHAALTGLIRIGDDPGGKGQGGGRNMSPLAGGVWHKPGDYYPGGVPALYSDYGHPHGETAVREMLGVAGGKSRSRKLRDTSGAFARAEDRAERILGHRLRDPRDEFSYSGSADVFGGFLASSTNPVGRRRSAGVKRKRQQSVTWVQRLNDRMEGR